MARAGPTYSDSKKKEEEIKRSELRIVPNACAAPGSVPACSSHSSLISVANLLHSAISRAHSTLLSLPRSVPMRFSSRGGFEECGVDSFAFCCLSSRETRRVAAVSVFTESVLEGCV